MIHGVTESVQARETCGSLDDFESILGKLGEYGHERVKPTSPTTYYQNDHDILHDCAQTAEGANYEDPRPAREGFYPQYWRSDLAAALREYFYDTEQNRTGPTVYESFVSQRMTPGSTVITFNYDVALERALAKAGKWDAGTGYGFTLLEGRISSPTTVYKLHGSVNWFSTSQQKNPPPYILRRDLTLLGFGDLSSPRLAHGNLAVNETNTLILPDPQKKFSWKPFWDLLWSAAAEQLRGASEVFIHGYSMPRVDARARELIFGNINRNAAIRVHCRRASVGIADEFRGLGFTDVKAHPEIGFETWAQNCSPPC